MRIFTVIKQERIVNIRLHHVDSKLDVLYLHKRYIHTCLSDKFLKPGEQRKT